jgi:hypothetical protein
MTWRLSLIFVSACIVTPVGLTPLKFFDNRMKVKGKTISWLRKFYLKSALKKAKQKHRLIKAVNMRRLRRHHASIFLDGFLPKFFLIKRLPRGSLQPLMMSMFTGGFGLGLSGAA